MTPAITAEEWAQIRSALETTLALPAGERPAFLEDLARRSPGVNREVEDLLAAEQHATRIFSIDRWHQSASELPVGAEPGMLVGRYRLLRELGRGGMGAVYLAERADGEYQHQVAVKLLQPSLLSPSIGERFRQERQILARLSHPGIARLLDGGVTGSGLLYAVMEYVEGEPIDQYCERRGLDIPARLRLFLRAAEAVQYAHQQLVLHLDIKPANLLVTGDGEPWLLDFGISRVMADSDEGTPQSVMTTRLLTPRYASPEQAAGEPLGVASDIFSLGTLLFRLLTGTLPYPIDNAAPLEAARLIREMPPQVPSHVASADIRQQLRGDLDLILLQALRKEPERRYPTVAAFADDLERYLTSRPVQAHGDSIGYRATRFVRRNRGVLAAAAIVFLVIAACVGLVVRSAVIARRQERLANRRLQDVRELADSYIFDLDPQLQGIPGTVAVRGYILKTGMKYLDAMAKEAGTDDELNDELARGYLRLSILENSFIYQSLGNAGNAHAAMDKAVALATAAYHRDPHDLNEIERYLYIAVNAAMTIEAQGDIAKYDSIDQHLWTIGQPLLTAENHPQGLFEMGAIAGELATNRIGNGALWNLADPVAGLAWAYRSQEIMARVRTQYPSNPLATRALVDSIYSLATEIDGNTELASRGAVDAALAELQRSTSQPAFKQDPTLAPARRVANDYILATLILEHRLPEAEAVAPKVRITEMPEKDNNSRLKIATARTFCMRGSLDLELGRPSLGTQEIQQGLNIYENLLRADPTDVNTSVQIVFCGTRLGLEPLASDAARRRALQRVIELSSSYATVHPEVASTRLRLATAWLALDGIDRDDGKLHAASEDAEQTHRALVRLGQLAPHQPQADLLASQLEAINSGELDHRATCRQRTGGLFFSIFLNGRQQIAACATTPVPGSRDATPAPAKAAPTPSHDGQSPPKF